MEWSEKLRRLRTVASKWMRRDAGTCSGECGVRAERAQQGISAQHPLTQVIIAQPADFFAPDSGALDRTCGPKTKLAITLKMSKTRAAAAG